jgi:hypothetical protein
MRIRSYSLLTALAVFTITLAMRYPKRHVIGVELGNSYLQSVLFASCMILWALARGGRLRSELDAATVRRNVLKITVELLLLAAVLIIGQGIMERWRGAIGDFFINALVIIVVGAVFYGIVARLLLPPYGKHLAQMFTRPD